MYMYGVNSIATDVCSLWNREKMGAYMPIASRVSTLVIITQTPLNP